MGQVASRVKKLRNRRKSKRQQESEEHTTPVLMEDHLILNLMALRPARPFLGIKQVVDVIAARTNCTPAEAARALGMDFDQNMPLLYSLARSWAWGAVAYRCQTHPGEASAVDYLGDNALHWTAFGRPSVDAVKHLLRADSTLAQVANKKGHMPLHVACSYKPTPAILRTIIEAYPAAAGYPTNQGQYPLHLLCDFGGSLEALRILLEFQETRDTIHILDGVFHRRPLEILNARKNRSEFQAATEKIRRARQRQQALMREVDQGVLLLSQVQDDLDALDDTVETYQSSLFWKKLALLIYAEHTGEAPLTRENEDGPPDLVVSGPEIFLASVANPNCPVVLQEFSILLHHNLLQSALDDHGNLPLHIAALSGNPSVITALVKANPLAASVHNHDGNLPFAVWLQRSERSVTPLQLLEACPSALSDQDYDPRYYPHIWSQLRTPDAIFESLRSQPDLLLSIQFNRAEI